MLTARPLCAATDWSTVAPSARDAKQRTSPESEGQERGFLLETKLNVPHRIPTAADGLWVSSVPGGGDVCVFSAAVEDHFVCMKRLAVGEVAVPYYLGKTPLYLRARPGDDTVVVVHAPLSEDPSYKPEWQTRDAFMISDSGEG